MHFNSRTHLVTTIAIGALLSMGCLFAALTLGPRGASAVQEIEIISLRRPMSIGPFTPSDLVLPSSEIADISVTRRSKGAIEVPTPVGICWVDGDNYYVCNYYGLFFVNIESALVREVSRPDGIMGGWVPTGLAYCSSTQELLVAGYKAKNVLILDVTSRTEPQLRHEIVGPNVVGPEGVVATPDGLHVAIADYDGNRVSLFKRDGTLLWSLGGLGGVHGIALGGDKTTGYFLIASTLAPPQVVRVSWTGSILDAARTYGEIGQDINGADELLYPTGVLRYSDDEFVVTDAFRGQLVLMSGSLHATRSVGRNGPSIVQFDNPYSCSTNATSGHVVVTDTFKDRLVEVDIRTSSIVRTLTLRNDPPDFSSPPGSTWVPVSDGSFVSYDFRRFPCAESPLRIGLCLPALLDSDSSCPLLLGCQKVYAPDINKVLLTAGRSPLYPNPMRFVLGKNGALDGRDYALLWSPECAGVLVCWQGVTVPIVAPRNLWMHDRGICLEDRVLGNEQECVQAALASATEYLRGTRGQSPLRAMHETLYGHMSFEDFRRAILEIGQSTAGQCMLRTLVDDPDNPASQMSAALNFVNWARTRKRLFLFELLVAETVLARR